VESEAAIVRLVYRLYLEGNAKIRPMGQPKKR
jgi:hypothetical protein